MNKKKMIAAAVASVGLTAFNASAQADTLINPATTSYQYTNSPGINFADGSYIIGTPGNPGNPVAPVSPDTSSSTFYTQYTTELNRVGNYGSGTLNDGLVGDQAYLNSAISHSGYYGASPTPPAYQVEGRSGQTGANGIANTDTDANNESVYYSSDMTVKFDLGANYTNLSTVTIYGDWDQTTAWSQFQNISVTDGIHTVTATQDSGDGTDGPPSDVPGGALGDFGLQGYYFAQSIDISSLSGEFVTLSFTNFGDTFAPLNEIQFATSVPVPEPASLSLLGIGSLALLRRRARRVR